MMQFPIKTSPGDHLNSSIIKQKAGPNASHASLFKSCLKYLCVYILEHVDYICVCVCVWLHLWVRVCACQLLYPGSSVLQLFLTGRRGFCPLRQARE